MAIRLYYVPFNVPIILDAFTFFKFASDIVVLGHLPDKQDFGNSGWPIFLSLFFGISPFHHYLDFMNLQRIISMAISVLTIIPVFLLCAKFVERKYAVIGSSIFILEPRVIQNSLLGITEPLYLFLGTTSLVLFLSNSKKSVYSSFFVTGLAIQVRQEAIFLLVLLTIVFFIRFRNKRAIIDYAISLLIFVITILPMVFYRLSVSGNVGIVSRAPDEATKVLSSNVDLPIYLLKAMENFVQYLGWISIPVFVFLVPIGIIYIFKNRDFQKYTIILGMIIMSLPALYAYSIPAQDTRYLMFLYPMFCVLAAFSIRKYSQMLKKPNFVLVLIIGVVLVSSIFYLEWKVMDREYELAAFEVSKFLIDNVDGVNDYYPESSYLEAANLPGQWPQLSSSIPFKLYHNNPNLFNSLEEYLVASEKHGITHILVDGKENRPSFLNDILKNKPPYLIEEFESFNLDYKVKIFKIDYELFHTVTKSQISN